MKALVSGFSSITPEYLFFLDEPVPTELSRNFDEKLIFSETVVQMRAYVNHLRELLPADDTKSKKLLEAILAAPKSRSALSEKFCDISIQNDDELIPKLTGPDFVDKFESLLEMNAVKGGTRQELFDRAFSRLVISANGMCIVDRYFGAQFSSDNFKSSGAYWALAKILELRIPHLRILASNRNANDTVIDKGKIEDRLRALHELSSGETEVKVYLGEPVHNRHITFSFIGGTKSFSMMVDKGLEVFQHEKLKEAPGIGNFSSKQAAANEAQVLSSGAVPIKIDSAVRKSA